MRIFLPIVVFLTFLCNWQTALAKPVSITAQSWLVADANGTMIKGENTD